MNEQHIAEAYRTLKDVLEDETRMDTGLTFTMDEFDNIVRAVDLLKPVVEGE